MDDALRRKVSATRRLLENPYALIEHLYPSGDREGETRSTVALRRYSDREIETAATDLLNRMWKERQALWVDSPPSDPIEIRDPGTALRLIGFDYLLEEVGQYCSEAGVIEVAGLIDRASKTVRVSGQFPVAVQLFTAAHELGHAVLHPDGGGVHRDRPVDGTRSIRDASEYEADKFASYFLMPRKLVCGRFVAIFGSDQFMLSDDTAFALGGKSLDEIRSKIRVRRDLSKLLASTVRYNGRSFASLAEEFGVSIEAMAIRLEELALVAI
jgi:hypothetical protein